MGVSGMNDESKATEMEIDVEEIDKKELEYEIEQSEIYRIGC